MENLSVQEILELPDKEFIKLSFIIELGVKKFNDEFKKNRYEIELDRLSK